MQRKYETALKTRVALEAIRGQKTIAEIAREYDVPANIVTLWKKAALENLPGTFSRKAEKKERDWEEESNDLYRQIGQLKVELEWLKKTFFCPMKRKGGSSARTAPPSRFAGNANSWGFLDPRATTNLSGKAPRTLA